MRRRSIICGLAFLLFVPEGASAQQPPGKIPRIGVLGLGESERVPMFDAFREGLRDLGYIEGRDIILEFRFAHGNRSLLPQLAAGLAALPVDVIGAEGYMAATGRVPTFPRS
jgi:putative ABC transport system substrate-binding protein